MHARTPRGLVVSALVLFIQVFSITPALGGEPVKARDPFGQVVPISGAMGLADLVLDLAPGEASEVEAEVWSHELEDWFRVPLLPRTKPGADPRDPSAPVRWQARVRLGPAPEGTPEVRARLFITPASPAGRPAVLDLEGNATVAPNLATPDWAKGAVYYQIFPERFRNGNPGNDPGGPFVYRMPWGADWYTVSDEELSVNKAAAMARGDRMSFNRPAGLLYDVVWHRRFGGDLQGVVEKLDHIASLGVDAIYFTPIFDAPSMHKYDAADFAHIDPTLGHPGTLDPHRPPASAPFDPFDETTWAWTEADRYFIEVVIPEARARGLRVVLDGVWNHTGREFWAFRDLVERGRESAFKDWYAGVRFDAEGRLVSWQAWDRPNGHLPKFRQTPEGDLVEPVKRHIFAVTRRWMDPDGDGNTARGIDGWRLDVAAEIGIPFWRDWRAHVRGINPDAVLIAEIWYDAAPSYFHGVAFDAQMNYPFAYPVTSWLGSAPEVTADALSRGLRAVFNNPPHHDLAQMNLVDSHDVERIASMMHNPGRTYEQGAAMHNDPDPDYDPGRPSPEAFDRAVLSTALLATYQGAPMFYYGNEFGMYGADDPDNRKPVPWPDLPPPERGEDAADLEILERTRAWLTLRQHPEAGPILRFGDTRHLPTTDPALFMFERSLNGDRVVVLINAGEAESSMQSVADGSRLDPNPMQNPTAMLVLNNRVRIHTPARSAQAWLIPREGGVRGQFPNDF